MVFFCFSGTVGRNFAAGMSGGIAYVLDANGDFATLCNTAMVELLPLEKEDDVDHVRSLLEEFVEKTSSDVAQELLRSWPESHSKFVKVFPYEYQRALLQQEEEHKKILADSPAKTNGSTNGFHKTDGIDGIRVNGSAHEKAAHKTADIQDIEDTIVNGAINEKSVDKTRGFLKYGRETQFYRPVEKRMKDWDEIYNFSHVRRGLRVQAARCMDCGVPFCQSSYGCPLGNIIPKWNDLVYQNKWKEALDQLLQTNNFPEFTGRVCPAPCESACVLGINSSPVSIKSIECAIIDHAFEHGWMKPDPPAFRSGKKVAIVGSGPAGLACAHQLNKVGHFYSIFFFYFPCIFFSILIDLAI